MFGKKPCVLCNEKDHRISDLKSQISSLEKLVFPQRATQVITADEENFDQLFNSPGDAEIKVDNDSVTVDREAQMLLSGDYSDMHGEI